MMPGQKATEAERRAQILLAAHQVALQRGIDGLTVRRVAARARLSHGLVLFHFKRKNQLVVAVLDRVLAATLPVLPEGVIAGDDPGERLWSVLRREADRLIRDSRQVRLFLEYWAVGTRQPAIRARIGAELERYRSGFRPLTEEVLAAEPARFTGVSPQALAAVAVSFINGCAVQAMIDPAGFDVEKYLAALRGMLGGLARLPCAPASDRG
jgi:TetR/AcrR family transcriptional regulator, transcriptional repressor of bet genes